MVSISLLYRRGERFDGIPETDYRVLLQHLVLKTILFAATTSYACFAGATW
jgi:hypothetical protein